MTAPESITNTWRIFASEVEKIGEKREKNVGIGEVFCIFP
jgi:hypothetical protein